MPPASPTVHYLSPPTTAPRYARLFAGAAALSLTALIWGWFFLCFTMSGEGWWGSTWFFVIAFGVALAIAGASFLARGTLVAGVIAGLAAAWAGISFGLMVLSLTS